MKFNPFGGEKFTPEQRGIQGQRDAYEKQAAKDARKQNTIIENLTGKGIDKEDVIRLDAQTEDEYRDKAIADSFYKELLDQHQKSTLTFDEKTQYWYDGSNHYKTTFVMEGLIAGKKVKIKGVTDDETTMNLSVDEGIKKISGTIDGKSISELFAKKILLKYQSVSELRKHDIEKIHEKAQQAENERKEQIELTRQEVQNEKARAKRIEDEKKLEDEKKNHLDILN